MQERRPFLATECDDLQKAEKFRRQIIGEVSRKVAQIQNGIYNYVYFSDQISLLLMVDLTYFTVTLVCSTVLYKTVLS